MLRFIEPDLQTIFKSYSSVLGQTWKASVQKVVPLIPLAIEKLILSGAVTREKGILILQGLSLGSSLSLKQDVANLFHFEALQHIESD